VTETKPLREFIVGVREVWVHALKIRATSPESAVRQAKAYGTDAGEEANFEYSHTLDTDLWSVEEMTSEGPTGGRADELGDADGPGEG
jgi:hypothetical protein